MGESELIKSLDRIPADFIEKDIVILDTEIDFDSWKNGCSFNLILVGGPVANKIVRQLIDEGISAVDWTSSRGRCEYIQAPYGGCDILIVAGKDRDATREAVQGLVGQI